MRNDKGAADKVKKHEKKNSLHSRRNFELRIFFQNSSSAENFRVVAEFKEEFPLQKKFKKNRKTY